MELKYIKYLPPCIAVVLGIILFMLVDDSNTVTEKAIAFIGAANLIILGFIWVDIKKMVK